MRQLNTEILEKEARIFEEICSVIMKDSKKLVKAATTLANLDVSCSLATVAFKNDFVRPKIDNSLEFDIVGGRHPVIEIFQAQQKKNFTSNDASLNPAQRLWLITGPNMGGKSTFLRQNALIAILAQIGSFVPARMAKVGIVDKLFSRVSLFLLFFCS